MTEMKKAIGSLVCWAIALTQATGATSGNGPVRDSLACGMDEVVVTATRTPLPLKRTPVITRVISARDIQRSGAVTLQQALERELAGVEFHQAGYGTSLSFQGLDSRYVLFLLDGERLAGETYGNIDFSRIPLSSVARIEVVRGASSVLYGSNAMGAVINIITREPRKKIEVGASIRYGTPYQRNRGDSLAGKATASDSRTYRNRLDLPNLNADLSLGVNLGKFRSRTAVACRMSDAFRLVGTREEVRHYGELHIMRPKMNGPRPEMDPSTGMPYFVVGRTVTDTTIRVAPDSRGLSVSGWSDLNVSQRFDYELSEKFAFQLSGSYFGKRRYDFNGSILDDNPLSNNTKPWTYESYEGYNLKAQMEHSPNERNKIYLSFYRDEYFRRQDSLGGASVPKQRHTYNIPRLLWTLDAGEYNRLTTGLEMTNEQLRFDLDPAGYGRAKSMNTGSLYVQDEICGGRPLSFVAGIRGNYNDRFGWSVTPSLSAMYAFRDFSLRANYSNGYRTPSLKEMYMEFTVPIPGQTSVIRGNDKLRSESNHYLSFTAEYARRRVDAAVTVYNSYFRNKIDVRGHLEGVTTILQYENVHRSEYGGIELTAGCRPAAGLSLRVDYNYVYQTDDAPESSTQYIYPSPHTAAFRIDYAFAVRRLPVAVNATVRYVGPKNYEDFMPVLDMSGGSMAAMKYWTGSYSSRHGGYAVCNAAVEADLCCGVSAMLGVDNIFDYRPSVVNFNSGIAMPRHLFVRLSYAFGRD
ncbi:TonB-dependent receptor [uncultured Alistipes sp.]|uniref:TonB-dependent receptor plug domain-containing protein n=1 Tax=uncultured Alistipes sp. TaxID=538949 RepID=UPI0026265DF3|nr:TonB-dependent receptor [uncultured Alistipes sp.]